MMTLPPLGDTSLVSMAEVIGEMPPGDAPAAWYVSLDPEVLAGYERFRADYQDWHRRLTELLELSGLTTERLRISGLGGDYLAGLYPASRREKPPAGWRMAKEGYLVPRKQTRAQKEGEINRRFLALRRIPRAVDYLPGVPNTLWMPGPDGSTHAYPVHVRKPAQAVVVLLGADPDKASQPFVPDGRWSRMKLSTFHLLRERKAARSTFHLLRERKAAR